ncbi:hypothetical protein [Pseudorhodobacter sp.]|uniref:hypothetical protein n=1 Tax=Pseudorhodobacter sp. TaxID=1934400 RepID=UPI002648F71F|nr:hypothetical protein [Pseudorhodobacter sp.]MDN5785792.1 hypothetical protein [Pseudorhodobacter sp.]
MRILEAHVEHARYARDFGQVEVLVAFLVKEEGRPVPRQIRIRTAEPAQGSTPLRQRLIASAKGLLIARHTGHLIDMPHAA